MVESNYSLDVLLPEPEGRSHRGCGSCGSGDAASKCGNGLEKFYPTTAVRFGYLRYIGEFTHAPDMKFTCGAKVIIQTRRGMEMGEQVSLTCNGCDRSVTREQMKSWVETCGDDSFIFDAGRILREATAADLAEYARIQSGNREKRNFCRRVVDRHKLPMKIVDCECPFGGERIIFFFLSEQRIDFRGLVRDLANEYRTRIEMRQIGARDEARLLADYETCGREVCCKVFLKTLKPISMRMAKLQKQTLDPSQVSGRCGRLKCCLRYEHQSYEELDKQLPKVGVRIRTEHGDGVIVNRQILTQLVQMRTDSNTLITVVAEDILAVGVPAPERLAPDSQPTVARPGVRSSDGKPQRPVSRGTPSRPSPSPPPSRRTGTPPTAGQPLPPPNPVQSEGGPRQDAGPRTGNEEGAPRRNRRRRGRRGMGPLRSDDSGNGPNPNRGTPGGPARPGE